MVPGLLSVRQVTGVLQQHAAKAICSESTLQYPEMLEVLCECAVLLRQQVQRKLAGPWVNLTEVISLYLHLDVLHLPCLCFTTKALPYGPSLGEIEYLTGQQLSLCGCADWLLHVGLPLYCFM